MKHLADRAGVALATAENIRTKREKRQRSEQQDLLELNKMAAKYFYYQLRTRKWKPGHGVS